MYLFGKVACKIYFVLKYILEVAIQINMLNKFLGGIYMFKSYSMDLAGRTLTVETGKMAGLANASVLVKYGETTVLVNATASKEPKEGIDFFPL